MKNRVRATGIVSFISPNYMETFCSVEIQSQWILFVYINFCCTMLFCKFNKRRSIALTSTVTVDKKHFY